MKKGIKTYRVVVRELRKIGYVEVRCNGSHHTFKKVGFPDINLAAHNNGAEVKRCYLRDIKKKTGLDI